MPCAAREQRIIQVRLAVDRAIPVYARAGNCRNRGLIRTAGRRAGILDLDLEVEQEADRLLLDRVHHRGEHVEAFALVFDEWIALRHCAQSDALL